MLVRIVQQSLDPELARNLQKAKASSNSSSNAPLMDGAFGIALYVRTFSSEPCYISAKRIATKEDIEGAIRFLTLLKENAPNDQL
jgi:hypothetical protein